MNANIENVVRNCGKCAEFQKRNVLEPLKFMKTPNLPYSEVGCGLFEFDSKHYIIFVDYSKYIHAILLNALTTSATINDLKSVFSCHDIPSILWSDNGPQFSSIEF